MLANIFIAGLIITIIVCIVLLVMKQTLWIGMGVMFASVVLIVITSYFKDKFSIQKPRSMEFNKQVDLNNDEW